MVVFIEMGYQYVSSQTQQGTLRVVTIAMICFTLLHFENFNISRGLYITQLNIYDGAFIKKAVKYIYKNAPSQIFTWVLNTPLLLTVLLQNILNYKIIHQTLINLQ